MTVLLYDTEGWNGFVQELVEAKEKVELQHESLIRHQSPDFVIASPKNPHQRV